MIFAPMEKGQGLIEYGMILILSAAVLLIVLALLVPPAIKVVTAIVQALTT